MEEENNIDEPPPISTRSQPSLIVYLLGRIGTSICFFHCSSERAFTVETACFPVNFRPGQLYILKFASCGLPIFCELSELTKAAYLDRHAFAHRDYERAVLRALLLHGRVHDFHQRAAQVIACSEDELALAMPNIPGSIPFHASFRTEWGELVEVAIDEVVRDARSMQLFCTPTQQLTRGLLKNSFLELDSGNLRVAIATRVMDDYLHHRRSIHDLSFFSRLYGEEASFIIRKIRKESRYRHRDREKRSLLLTLAQSEAVWRYQEPDCPGFVLEGSTRTGKATTIAAMTFSIAGCSPGEDSRDIPPRARDDVQLIISPTQDSLRELAMRLEALEVGNLCILNISETDYGSACSLSDTNDAENNEALALLWTLKEQLRYATRSEAEELQQQLPRAHRAAVRKAGIQDIVLVTLEDLLYWLVQDPARQCPMQKILQKATRIIIHDAHAVSESELNALALLYSRPGVKIVGVGDRTMIPPRGYGVVDQLGGISALELMMRKKNLPIIKLTKTFGEEDQGSWQEPEPEVKLEAIFKACRSGSNRLFVGVRASHAIPSGKSYINDSELAAAEFVVRLLMQRGVGHNQVLVVALHSGQLELAKTRLPIACEVVSLEGAECRLGYRRGFKDVTIILITGDEHHGDSQELYERGSALASSIDTAVIVLGHLRLRSSDPWAELLRLQNFDHLTR